MSLFPGSPNTECREVPVRKAKKEGSDPNAPGCDRTCALGGGSEPFLTSVSSGGEGAP